MSDDKKEVQLPFRVTPQLAQELRQAATATHTKVQDLMREAAHAIVRAHRRSRDGRVPKDMEIRPRYYPEVHETNWELAEAPPGETLTTTMQQSPREAAAFFAGRLRGELIVHPHFVHARSRGAFLQAVRWAVQGELMALEEATPGAAVVAAADAATRRARNPEPDTGRRSSSAGSK